ncbi:response regulator [Deinococcus roseus]|uniref:Response regulatory domain-containing protein n=1 Tax=Deinococcus roseus TaxID=392414 RepID=A0ABQ2DEU0_9DEIO|nr:response regulator [Deinococcus roseus]GGJ55495.1 hypothetical protein GCM10008938_47070 [Deinococcus roseus]
MTTEEPRVLVVEDDTTVRRMLVRFLKLNHFQVLEASDFEAALQVIEQHCDFELVLLDVNFPGGGGQKLLPILKEKCGTAKVVIVSAVEEAQVMFDLLAGGASDFIPKPFDITRLLEKVETLLAPKPED